MEGKRKIKKKKNSFRKTQKIKKSVRGSGQKVNVFGVKVKRMTKGTKGGVPLDKIHRYEHVSPTSVMYKKRTVGGELAQ